MKSKKILITGGAGYIGQNLIAFFLKEKCKIYAIDNFLTSKPINKKILSKISFYEIDLSNKEAVKSFFKNKNFDLIIHLAACSGVKEFNEDILKNLNNNVLATDNLLKFGLNKKKTKLIFASSAAVYGKVSKNKIDEKKECNPINYYGFSKLVSENIIINQLKKKKTRYAILRYFNVVGSIIEYKIYKKVKSLFDIIANNIKEKKYKININGKKLKTIDGTPERDFIHIKDLCEIHKKTFSYLNKNNNIILNCGTGKRYSVLRIVKEFEKKIGKKFKIDYKKKNINETETICSNINLLHKKLKIRNKKNKIKYLVQDYLRV